MPFEPGHKFIGKTLFQKGKSGNPKGRPPVENSIAGIVRQKTRGGNYLVDRAMELSKSKDEQVALRALEFMASYGFVKPAVKVGLDEETNVSLLRLVSLARQERGIE